MICRVSKQEERQNKMAEKKSDRHGGVVICNAKNNPKAAEIRR